ncbi:hypothetical protein BWQ96_04199 [Gracilariopsis chorda]|uniref:Uncharacterized protein n=1 Tax=Gracilariopsis chorda TaxID=448386 RepID=A0A2V3IV72_9FLOR|nr:hypothetical protein BWQ96_04199 [Gracilariopsis chorda]|eukprot:PXF46024.1 hypothetical protein BWQ96_04199 [Gracilariopsis chorda]
MIVGGHGNATINASSALLDHGDVSFPRGSLRSRFELVNYPYLTAAHQKQRISRALSPDYVIRRTHLQADLEELLRTFECRPSFASENVHVITEDKGDTGNSTCALCSDELFDSLRRHAERYNERGLLMARRFTDW